MSLYGIEPDPMGGRQRPFITDERYVKAKGGKRRLAKNLKSREWYRVGYPRLTTRSGEPYYEVWETNGGKTFDEAYDYLAARMAIFEIQVKYYNEHGRIING